METHIIINVEEEVTRIALTENNMLTELYYEKVSERPRIGDIYCAKVRDISSGLNAAFVDIGDSKYAFLHCSNLSPNFVSQKQFIKKICQYNIKKVPSVQLERNPKRIINIKDVIEIGEKLLVQVVKEPISNKGATVSTDITLIGRYGILTPFSNKFNISRKISEKSEKNRLKKIFSPLLPPNFGAIIRTVSEQKTKEVLEEDIKKLIRKWEVLIAKIKYNSFPSKMMGEATKIQSIIRDIFNKDFMRITIDKKEEYEEIKNLIYKIEPSTTKSIKLYSKTGNIFEYYGLERQIKLLFGKNVNLISGGYLTIDHTEALHVIDVNSGYYAKEAKNQEENAFQVNKEAMVEVCRQLRLRDMGGIIIVDFIDMKKIENRKEIYNSTQKILRKDKAKSSIYPLTKLGLMQITRQKLRPPLDIKSSEVCPTCKETKDIDASLNIAEDIQNKIMKTIQLFPKKKIVLYLHPYLFAFFTQGLFSIQNKLFFKFFTWVYFKKDTCLNLNEYYFFDKNNKELLDI